MPTTVQINTAANPAFVTIPDSSASTLAATYAAGTVAADQTLLIQAGDGGPVIIQANAAATGVLLQMNTSGAVNLFNVSDTAGVTIGANTNLTVTAGTTAVDLSAGTGVFKTTTGAHTFGSASWALTSNTIMTDGGATTLRSSQADGAGAIGAITDTSVAWTNTSAKIQSFRTNTVEKFSVYALGDLGFTSGRKIWDGTRGISLTFSASEQIIQSTANDLYLRDSSNNGFVAQNAVGGGYLSVGGANTISFSSTALKSTTNLAVALGDSTHSWSGTWSSWYMTIVGAQLTAANTITPTSGIHHVTGNTVIKTIATTNVPGDGATFTLIADTNTVNWDATGNIAVAGVVTTALRTITFTWDATAVKWYPSAVA